MGWDKQYKIFGSGVDGSPDRRRQKAGVARAGEIGVEWVARNTINAWTDGKEDTEQ